ncbi:MAG: acyltransferase, partial [Acetobacteraceae bacterium]|nr:acyltransferase [Acetobacteraceae bacterium]
YLVTGSWERTPRLGAFLAKRALRIFPGLIACVLATILVIGPLATSLPLRWYVLNKLTVKYLANVALYLQLWLPGVFQGQQWNSAVNPMLWTLVPGLLCFLAVPALARLPRRSRSWVLLTVAVLCAGAALFLPEGYEQRLPAHLAHILGRDVLIEVPFFLVGALLRWLDERVRGRSGALWRADLAMLFFAANWIAATWIEGWDIIVEWVTLPYMAACFGRLSAPLLGEMGRLGNPSYGLYLYAFPIQQLIVARMPGNPHPILTCAALTVPVAFLSWHLVERPALRWAEPGGVLRRWVRRASPRAAL